MSSREHLDPRELRRARNRRYRKRHLAAVKLIQAIWYMDNAQRIKDERIGVKPRPPVFQINPLIKPTITDVTLAQGETDMDKRLTVEQAAEFLTTLAGVSVSVSSVRSWKRLGLLGYYKFKNTLLFNEADLCAFFEAHRVAKEFPSITAGSELGAL